MPAQVKPARPKQDTPAEIVNDLLGAIRNQFYPDATVKKWEQDAHFLRRNVVLWPAAWLNSRGVTLPPARYKEIILGVLNEVKVHGKTEVVKYWPGYLKHCLQEHFRHQGEGYYEEAKDLRSTLEIALSTAKAATATVDPITVLAEARRDLLKQPKRAKPQKKTSQPELF